MTELDVLNQYREILHSQLSGLYDQDVVPIEEVHYLVTELGRTIFEISEINNPVRFVEML